VDVTYAYDRNGVVQVAATDRASGARLRLAVEPLPEDVPGRFAGAPSSSAGPATVYLVFDVSGSMDGGPLEEARKAARRFVEECDLSALAVGVIAVSNEVKVLQQASHEAREVERAIASLTAGMTGYGNSGHPFDEIHRLLGQVAGRRFAVVLADGVWSDQPAAVRQAKRCHAAEIEVIGVGFGGADEDFLRDISTGDRGIFTDLARLADTFGSIAQELAGGHLRRVG